MTAEAPGWIGIRPLRDWPGTLRTANSRKRAPFTVQWRRITSDLRDEIRLMGARNAVLGLAISDRDLRNDGWIRANAQPEHPGVVLQLEKAGKRLSFPCDRHPHWEDNVRAISLTLAALRAVDRYGVVASGAQYVGFGELPSGRPMGSGVMSVEEAARFIAQNSDDPEGRLHDVEVDPSFATVLFREAAKRLHPDVGGNPETFRKLVAARDLIESSR